MSSPERKRRKKGHNISRVDSFDSNDEGVSGVIQNVTVKNFMCHEHLSVDFNEKINLVQGRNGSGKSAILTAVVVAFGGSTRITNRGSSLKDLIKYDKHTATVQVVIKNDGKEAFKSDVFGQTIIIERKLNSSGVSNYSLKSDDGTVVSTKKDELKRMCEHFNLNVENPLTVLNQDMSRSFLHSSDPSNLYKFFYEATQLQQMTDYYREVEQNLEVTKSLLENFNQTLPMIRREVQELHQRHQACEKRTDAMQKLRDLRKEWFWSEISEFEKKKEILEIELKEVIEILTKGKEGRMANEAKLAESQERQKNLEAELQKLTSQVEKERVASMKKEETVTRAKAKCKELIREIDRENRKINSINKDIEALIEVIKRDNAEAREKWEEFNRRQQEEKAQIESQIEEVEQLKTIDESHLGSISHTKNLKLSDRQQLQFEEKNKRKNIVDLEQELKSLRSQQGNAFTVFGQWVPLLLEKIEVAYKQRKFSAKPVGPLGAYIEMRDSKWTHIAEMVIGGRILAFCVNTSQDERVLRSLFQGINFGDRMPTIICCKFRARHSAAMIAKFEVKSEKYPSLWSVMNFKSDVVANFIIDRCQAESILLIETASEAGQILKSRETVPLNCKIAYTLNGDKYFPDPNYKVYSGSGQRDARFLQVSVQERVQYICNYIETLKKDIDFIRKNSSSIDVELRDLQGQERSSSQKIQGYKKSIQTLRLKITQLQNEEGPPPPPNVNCIEEDIKEQQRRRSEAEEKTKELDAARADAEATFQKASEDHIMFIETRKEGLQKAKNMQEEMLEAKVTCNKLLDFADSFAKKFRHQEKAKRELEAKVEIQSKKVEEGLHNKEKFMPRRETERSSVEVKKQYLALEQKLKMEEEKMGDRLQVAKQYKERCEEYSRMKKELEECQNIFRKLDQSLQDRWIKGRNFRKTLSILVKTGFTEALSSRNLKGKILFDFEKETLTIHIDKLNGNLDNARNDTASPKKVLKRDQQEKLSMMSGGERSFSTVALILSLWEVMESPIRILDEFDVFMDIIARRQSLDMMISKAKPTTQYIYLTPLEVRQSHYTGNLNVFRMPDPEREKENNN